MTAQMHVAYVAARRLFVYIWYKDGYMAIYKWRECDLDLLAWSPSIAISWHCLLDCGTVDILSSMRS